MHILVIGAGGMLGAKLVAKLAQTGELQGRKITRVTRHDVVLCPPPPAADFEIITLMGDLSDAAEAKLAISEKPGVIFQLAAIVSGEAEADFDKGYRINLLGMQNLLEAVRQHGSSYCPRIVFTSSIAVFGAPFPSAIADDFFTTPLTSYGTQKAICELLLADYSRKRFCDGVALRMPTVCVRPGKPNKAASGFFSNIIREPLVGMEAILPVPDSVRHWHAAPRTAVAMLIHGAEISASALGNRRAINMPGVSCTVAEQIAALRRVAGDAPLQLIRREADETVMKIVAGWPENFSANRAMALGFRPDDDFDSIIRAHIDDELQGKIV